MYSITVAPEPTPGGSQSQPNPRPLKRKARSTLADFWSNDQLRRLAEEAEDDPGYPDIEIPDSPTIPRPSDAAEGTPPRQTTTTPQMAQRAQPQPQSSNKNLRVRILRSSAKQGNKNESVIWKLCKKLYDPVTNSRYAVCNHCGLKNDVTKTTSNCRKHLRTAHPIKFAQAEKDNDIETDSTTDADAEITDVDAEAGATCSKKNEQANGEGQKKSKVKQLSLKKSLKLKSRKKPYPRTSPRKQYLDKLLIQFICTDFQPFSIVEDKGFIRLCHGLDSRYVIPCRQTVTDTLLPGIYEQCKLNFLEEIRHVKYMSITFDTWTSNAKKNYLGITGHYVRDFDLRTCLLSFAEASESHTSDDLAKIVKFEVIEKYPLVKVMCCVTDSAANMIKTAKNLNIRHVPCFLHRVQTTVNKAIALVSSSKDLVQLDNLVDENKTPISNQNETQHRNRQIQNPNPNSNQQPNLIPNENEVQKDLFADLEELDEAIEQAELTQPRVTVLKTLIKVKRITCFFNQSTTQTDKLRKALKASGKTYSNLIQSVATRWNSVYMMLERFYDCIDEINAVLCRIKHKLDLLIPEEIAVIPDLLNLLKPFADLNLPLSGEKVPTISLIIPSVTTLYEMLEEMELQTTQGKELKEQLFMLVDKYLAPYEENDFCSWATILDPRFKDTRFRTNQNKTKSINGMRNYLVKVKTTQIGEQNAAAAIAAFAPPLAENRVSSAASVPKPKQGMLERLFGCRTGNKSSTPNIQTASSNANNTRSEVIVLLNGYITSAVLPGESPLHFWKNYNAMPELQHLAARLLSIPASSTASERVFSAGGNTCSNRRSNLTSDHLEKTMYVNRNSRFVCDAEEK